MADEAATLTDPGHDAQERSADGRFEATLEDHAVLDAMQAVLLTLVGGEVALAYTISMRDFDRARRELGYAGLPSADAICARVRRRWPHTVALALKPAGERNRFAGNLESGRHEANALLIRKALRAAAFELGVTPTPHDYDVIVQRLDDESERVNGYPHGFPCSRTIIQTLGWDLAIRDAGLERRPRRSLKAPHSRVELLDRCISETGILPTRMWFELVWGRSVGLPVPRGPRTHAEEIAEVRELRALRGDTTLERMTPYAEAPVLELAPDQSRRPVSQYTRAEKIAAVRAYLDSLRRGERATTAGYKVYRATTNPKLPSLHAIVAEDGWSGALAEAREQ